MQRHLEFPIPTDHAGATLIEFLLARFPYHPRDGWLARITAGQIHVNGTAAAADRTLAAGDRLEYTASDVPEPRVSFAIEALFDDGDLLVVNKPPNLPCHPSGRYFHHTLWALLKRDFGIEAPALVNRLDRETSGVVVVAKTGEAARKCRTQFAQRRVEKRYIALVEGQFPDALHAAGILTPDPGAAVQKRRLFCPAPAGAPADPRNPEWAETRFRRLAQHGAVSEIEAAPLTGRLHQIRATLSAVGFPIVGDKVYGVDPGAFLRFCTDALTDEDRRRLRMERQALHAAGLRFRHPRTAALLEVEAPLPADMAGLIRRLDADSSGSTDAA